MRLLSSRTTEVEGPIWFSSFATNGKRQSMRITWLLWCGWRNVSGTPRGSSGYLTEYLCKSYFGTNPIPFPSLNWAVLLSQILSRVQLSAAGIVRTAWLCNREMGSTAHKFTTGSILRPCSCKFLQHDRKNKCPIIVYRQEDYHNWTIGKPLLKGFLNIPSGKRLHNYGKSPL